MNVQDAIQRFRTFFRRSDTPTPRWQVLVASFYLGMLIYLLMYQYGIM
jgi:hypothetical protein